MMFSRKIMKNPTSSTLQVFFKRSLRFSPNVAPSAAARLFSSSAPVVAVGIRQGRRQTAVLLRKEVPKWRRFLLHSSIQEKQNLRKPLKQLEAKGGVRKLA